MISKLIIFFIRVVILIYIIHDYDKCIFFFNFNIANLICYLNRVINKLIHLAISLVRTFVKKIYRNPVRGYR